METSIKCWNLSLDASAGHPATFVMQQCKQFDDVQVLEETPTAHLGPDK